MKPTNLDDKREKLFSLLLLALMAVVVPVSVLGMRSPSVNQPNRPSGFTMISTQTTTFTDTQKTQLDGIHVRYQRADGTAKDIQTYFKQDGAPQPEKVSQYLRHGDKLPFSEDNLRQDPHFVREESVLGFSTFVVRFPDKNNTTEYREIYIAPALQAYVKHVIVSKGMIQIVEPVKIILGEPDERITRVEPLELGTLPEYSQKRRRH